MLFTLLKQPKPSIQMRAKFEMGLSQKAKRTPSPNMLDPKDWNPFKVNPSAPD